MQNDLSLISELSELLLSFDHSWDEKINGCLNYVGKTLDVSRVYLFKQNENMSPNVVVSQQYEWVAQGVTPEIDNQDLINFDCSEHGFMPFMETLMTGKEVALDVADMEKTPREILSQQDIKTVLWVPIFTCSDWWGFVGFDECRSSREWTFNEINSLKMVTSGIGAAITRSQYDHKDKVISNLMSMIDDVYLVHDIEHNCFCYISDSFDRVWPMAKEKITFNPISLYDACEESQKKTLLDNFLSRLKGLISTPTEEFQLIDKYGESNRWIKAQYTPVEVNGVIVAINYYLSDITEQRHKEHQLMQEWEEQKNILVREVHHRIKNHLQGVSGLLSQKAKENPEAADAMNIAISQIQSVARVHGLQGQSMEQDLNFYALLESIIQGINHVTELNVILKPGRVNEVHLIEPESIPIALIMNELLMNAVKHSSQDEAVSVSIEGDEKMICVSIENAGVLPESFDFSNRKTLGSGLSLVSSLMPSRGVKLSFSGEHDKVMTRFELFEPVVYR